MGSLAGQCNPCSDNPQYRTINGGNPQAGIQGPGTFLIQKNLSVCTDILEVTVQPVGATSVQLVEGGNPSSSITPPNQSTVMTPLWSLAAGQPWSAPGKRIKNDLYIIITAAVIVQVEVRYRIPNA